MTILEKVQALPKSPGVYIMYDGGGTVIYVGKAKSLKHRVQQYFGLRSNRDTKVAAMLNQVADFSYIVTPSELDAFALEKNLVLKHQPHYNILLKDGKAYQYIRIDLRQEFPALEVTRRLKKDGARYFGPYFNGLRAQDIIRALQHAYPVRACNTKITSKPKRACLNRHLSICSGPCAGLVSKDDYMSFINSVVAFLNGNSAEVESVLIQEMECAAKAEQYETAILLRDMLAQLKRLTDRTIAYLPREVDIDAIGYASNGIQAAIAVFVVRGGRGIGCERFHIIDASLSLEECLVGFLTQYYTYNSRVPKEILLPVNIPEDAAIREWLNGERGSKVNLAKPERGNGRKLLETAIKNAEEFLEKEVEKEKAYHDFTLGAVEQLQKELGLSRVPHRIEAYDISNISGVNKTASMVVFLGGEPAKAHYRKFIIKTVEGADDYASMQEVLRRRLSELDSDDLSFSAVPDLILIDGGKGQLSAALEVLQEFPFALRRGGFGAPRANEDGVVDAEGGAKSFLFLNHPVTSCHPSKEGNFARAGLCSIAIISLAERNEEIFLPNNPNPIILPRHHYALRLLQRVRDEAHRFAITFHRKIRGKDMQSQLENIAGIGPAKRRELLKKLKSINAIKQASVEQLMTVPKITRADAERIAEYFRKTVSID
ncbi:MAG: excinuclease ABC subunit UvrC [Firmicutes bacterium]|nr:excinuclease ABC subunit UvrC [Bacillota bacterium]